MPEASSSRHAIRDGSRQFVWALILALGMVMVVGTALFFEHRLGFVPCALCLEQRTPYYIGVPVALFAALAAWTLWPGLISRTALAAVGLLMVYGFVLGAYHAGVEWQWWAGPTDCAPSGGTSAPTDASNLLGALNSERAPACDQAAGRFLGLSFAGWNVIASAILAAMALRGAFGSAD